jgi:hypothetical protein
LPSRFGDFGTEYAALRETVGLVDTNFRAFFSFTAPDRQRYVNAILTSNVRDLKPGRGTVGLLLNPQGHILAEVETFAREESILASSHAMIRERTLSTFDKFIIMDDALLEDVTGSTGTLDLAGPRTTALLRRGGRDFFTYNPGLLNQPLLYVQRSSEDEPRVLLDPNTLSKDGTIALQSAIAGMTASLVGMLFAAYGYLPPVAGAILQEVIDILAVANAARAAWPPRSLSDF